MIMEAACMRHFWRTVHTIHRAKASPASMAIGLHDAHERADASKICEF